MATQPSPSYIITADTYSSAPTFTTSTLSSQTTPFVIPIEDIPLKSLHRADGAGDSTESETHGAGETKHGGSASTATGSSNSDGKGSSSSISRGEAAGIAVGAVFGALLIGLGIFLFIRRRRRAARESREKNGREEDHRGVLADAAPSHRDENGAGPGSVMPAEPELEAVPRPLPEMPDQNEVREMPTVGNEVRVELSGESVMTPEERTRREREALKRRKEMPY